MAQEGWIGMVNQVEHYLDVVGADRDAEGHFVLFGESSPSTFMGAGEEIVIPGDLCYKKNGHPVNLAAGLRTTSYGLGVVVI